MSRETYNDGFETGESEKDLSFSNVFGAPIGHDIAAAVRDDADFSAGLHDGRDGDYSYYEDD